MIHREIMNQTPLYLAKNICSGDSLSSAAAENVKVTLQGWKFCWNSAANVNFFQWNSKKKNDTIKKKRDDFKKHRVS